MGIKTKLLVFMIFLNILPVSMLGLFAYKKSASMTLDQTEKVYHNHLETYDLGLDLLFGILSDTMRATVSDRVVTSDDKTLLELLEIAIPKKNETYWRHTKSISISTKINNTINDKSNIMNVVLFDKANNKYFVDFSHKEAADEKQQKHFMENPLVDDLILSSDWYKKVVDKHGAIVFFPYNVTDAEDASSFSCAKVLVSTKHYRSVGMVIINIDKALLKKIFPGGAELDNASFILVDSSDPANVQLIYQFGQLDNLQNIIEAHYNNSNPELMRNYMVESRQNLQTGWDILYVLDRDAIINSASVTGKVFVMISIIFVVLLIVLNYIMATSINSPLKKLQEAIMGVAYGNDLSVKVDFGDDEIGKIGKEFQSIATQNLQLKENLYKMDIQQKEAEIKALQAQINPHFLYNSLDSIYWKASIEGAHEAAKLAICLSSLFKANLHDSRLKTTVRNELKQMNDYTTIIQLRFGDKISFCFDVDDELMEYDIVRFLLQPILENAVEHGLEPKLGKGILVLTGRLEGSTMVFTIQDDGVGLKSPDEYFFGFGLNNVQERIRLYYGEQYGLQFESAPNEGTIVTLRLPVAAE